MEVDDWITAVSKRRSLIRGRHIAVSPVRCSIDRAAAIVGEYNKSRQILVLAAQTVGDPTADAGMAGEDAASAHLKDRRAVRRALGVHRTNQGQIICVFGHMRKQLGYLHPALAVFAKRPRRGHQAAGRPHRGTHFAHSRHLLSLPFEQQRLGIECVNLADAAVAEDRNHGSRFDGEVWWFWRERRSGLRQQPVAIE